MREMTGFDWFMGVTYHTDVSASLLRDIADSVREELSAEPFASGAVKLLLEDRSNRSEIVVGDQVAAYERVLSIDLASIRHSCADPAISALVDQRRDFESVLNRTASQATAEARKLGLNVESEPNLHFVAEFPEPYGDSSAAVLAVDGGDQREFGVEPGLYLRPNVRPFYTEFIVCHELIHVFLGELSPDIFSSRLEEGVAEVLGAGHIATQLLGLPLVKRLFVLNRLSRSHDLVWERYLEATRQVWHFILGRGLGDMVTLLNGGRANLNELESALITGALDGMATSTSPVEIDADLASLMNSVCLTYPRSLISSPGAVLLAPFLGPGSTIREAAVSASLTPAFALECAKELQNDLGLLAVRPDGAVVTFSEADRVARSGMLRYRSAEDDG